MSKNGKGIGFINNILIIPAAIIVSGFSIVYKRLIKRPIQNIFEWLILPLLDTLDDDYGGILVFFIFMIELGLSLIVPWFFSWKIGLIFVSYLLITFGIIMIMLERDNPKPPWITFFIIWIVPYLTMAFVPTVVITIVRKKEKPVPTTLQLRKTKLRRLKKQIRKNKYKFWKK